MGSTSEHRESGLTNLEWLRQEVCNDPKWGEILDAATVNNSVIYAAWKLGAAHGDQEGLVVGLVVLIHWTRDYYNFTHKEMTDSMGPNEAHCPKRILDLLGPPENDYATEWRAACQANIDKRAAARKVTPGTVVRFARPIEFTSGATLDEFTFEKGNTFRSGYSRYRITGWRGMDFTVGAAA